ncbi:MAG TPA: lipid-A-disaccharide synthase [Elusimicrobiales bacterium]|nr:lipid-A-disaccharide synthase [Elusimicrobiales bacterium]
MSEIVPTTKNILIVAGDASGDLHGANLIKALKDLDPEVNIAALGGPKIQNVCDRFIYNLTSVGTNGFIEPFFKLMLWVRIINVVRKYMEEKRPACMIAIDFYGLNHQLLGLAQHRKIPAYYYISPQVWASRPQRAHHLARLVKHMLVIFPFETKIYKEEGAECTFVGHPLLDVIPQIPKEYKPPLDKSWKIGLLPGSRPNEIKKHMSVFWQAFKKILKTYPKSQPYIFTTENTSDKFITDLCKPAGNIKPQIIRENDYEIRKNMDFVITCSGTATLENALLELPMTVVYKMSAITYQIAKRVINIPYISLVNIIADKNLVTELIQHQVTPANIANSAIELLQNTSNLLQMRENLGKLKKSLGTAGAAKKAAGIILKSVFRERPNGENE